MTLKNQGPVSHRGGLSQRIAARPDYCPCYDEKPDPCPACGATVSGKDAVRGVCQARRGYRHEPLLRIILTDKQTGEPI
jgi:hypothetical protein